MTFDRVLGAMAIAVVTLYVTGMGYMLWRNMP